MVDPYLKTARAKEHIDTLRNELQVLYDSKPYRFAREDDLKDAAHIIRFYVNPIPDKIALILGDIFYNLRASLDQLAWCLARLPSPQRSYPTGTQFPILEQRDTRRFKSQTRGIAADAVTIIESLQPYNTPHGFKNHVLWKLNKMCNIDKHMRIPIHGHSGQVWRPPSIAASGYGFQGLNNYFEMRIPLARKNEMALDPPITMKVVFGDHFWGITCDFSDIEAIYNFVTNTVIPKFARFLE
jgi:hypothetical protein